MFYKMNVIYCLKKEKQRQIGEYFEIVKFKKKYLLYYSCFNKIKLVLSDTLDFTNIEPIIVIENSPTGSFCIVNENDKLLMLCGYHGSDRGENETQIPDFVRPKNKRKILDWTVNRNDRRNGMYLLESYNGVEWKEINNIPVLHCYEKSDTCRLGEIGFDTHPCLIKDNGEYIFFGRLNSSFDERRIYARRSKDLINWTPPEKINITNENKNNLKKNYYHFVVFKKNNLFYAFTPYFESCGTEKKIYKNGCTMMLISKDATNWEIKKTFLHHVGKYKDRVNSVFKNDKDITLFLRQNVLENSQNLISYNLNI